ncbi:molybdopterin synthase catalytic subunit [uncultured bacterium]|nr:molybdopterin synthase catalytic subunit [uncultured bacterium]
MTARLVTGAIDPAALLAEVSGDGHGATVLFLGTVRNSNDGRPVDGIDYTAYDAMAVVEIERIVAEAVARFPGIVVAVEHRTGTLRVGDVSVAIACGHAHRGPALDANRFVIEQLKRRVPIWKREHYLDGTSEWVDPTRPALEATP